MRRPITERWKCGLLKSSSLATNMVAVTDSAQNHSAVLVKTEAGGHPGSTALNTAKGKGKGHPITGHEGPREGGWSAPRSGRFTPGKDPVPIVQEAGWAQGRSGCAKNLAPPPPPTGIRAPDRPARSQSLYRLSYPAHALSTVPY
jgi:hypothetical protein